MIASQLSPRQSLIEGSGPRLVAFGGDMRDRTADPLLAKQVLSQLSYTPIKLVGLSGLEPPTLRLSVVRSSQLSYRPIPI